MFLSLSAHMPLAPDDASLFRATLHCKNGDAISDRNVYGIRWQKKRHRIAQVRINTPATNVHCVLSAGADTGISRL